MDKAYLTKEDIMERYDVSINVALRIMREVSAINGECADGTIRPAIAVGKLLPSELEYWEKNRGRIPLIKRQEEQEEEWQI